MPRRKRTANLHFVDSGGSPSPTKHCDCCFCRIAQDSGDCLDGGLGPIEHADAAQHAFVGELLAAVAAGEYETAACYALRLSRTWLFIAGTYAQRQRVRESLMRS